MKTIHAVTPEILAQSVIAVPPLARDEDFALCRTQNQRVVRHLETGGIRTLLYGGNANLYHIQPGEYQALLHMLEEITGPDTIVIPSAGPSFGWMMEQAEILRGTSFPTVMVLPQSGITTDDGVRQGLRMFAERLEKPVVVYLKQEDDLSVSSIATLLEEGLVSWIKYAVVRDDPGEDRLLRELLDHVDSSRVVSGMGEQPAVVHLRDFGMAGFTSGCVSVAPRLSSELLAAVHLDDWDRAEQIRETFRELEDLRDGINPIRVLHEAVALAGIADTGPHLPLLSALTESERERVRGAARSLLEEDRRFREGSR